MFWCFFLFLFFQSLRYWALHHTRHFVICSPSHRHSGLPSNFRVVVDLILILAAALNIHDEIHFLTIPSWAVIHLSYHSMTMVCCHIYHVVLFISVMIWLEIDKNNFVTFKQFSTLYIFFQKSLRAAVSAG